MKIRKLFITAGLAIAALVGVGAALSASPKAGTVKAEGEKTWMFGVSVKMDAVWNAATKDGANIVNQRFHVWGTNVDQWADLHFSGVEGVMTANISLADSQEVTGGQFYYEQQGGTYPGEKYSKDLTFSATKASHPAFMDWTATTNWEGSKWELAGQSQGYLQINYSGGTVSFAEDPANNRFALENLNVAANATFGLHFRGSWNNTYALTRAADMEAYAKSYADHWFSFKEAGQYDIYFENELSDGGVLSIKKHDEAVNTYIYYVTDSEDVTPDYIYTFGATEQFGAFPGSKIVDVAEDVTGVLHFNGAGVVRIYKIPVKIGGYKSGGDTGLVFAWYQDEYNNGQGSDQDLEAACAYYWDSRNANAGAAIDFLLKVEAKRNAVVAEGKIKNYSVCGISESDAAALYNEYAALTAPVKTIVNNSSTWTYKGDGTNDEDVIGFVDIMDQLAQMAEVGPYAASLNFAQDVEAGTTATIIIVAVTIVSIAGLCVAIIIRKRRLQNN